jgi:hypothetical protein
MSVPNEFICVHAGVDRASCLMHWGAWLPIETEAAWADEIAEIRRVGRTVVQVSHLKSSGNHALLREVFRQIVLSAIALRATDLITVVNPAQARSYSRFYFNLEIGRGTWTFARDEVGALLPVAVVRMALDRVPQAIVDRFLAS